MTNFNQRRVGKSNGKQSPFAVAGLHPSWFAFIRYCQDLGFGEISKLKVQDGVPVMAEETTKKVKFT